MTHSPIDIPVELAEGVEAPEYGTADAAGADVRAHLKDPIIVAPGEWKLIPTGIKMAIPSGYEVQVRPRSGLALKQGVTVLNTPGTIDADYRGEVGVVVINHNSTPFTVEPKMRIAQLILMPVLQARFSPTATLETTARGAGGFGHTGVH